MNPQTFFIHCHRIDSKFHQGAASCLEHWTLKLHMQSVWLHNWGLWAKPYCQFLGLTFLKASVKLNSCRKIIKPPGEGNTHNSILVVAKQKNIASCILAIRKEAEKTEYQEEIRDGKLKINLLNSKWHYREKKKKVQRLERPVGNWERACKIILNNEILYFLKASLKEVDALFSWK